jgi:hypothetical protein
LVCVGRSDAGGSASASLSFPGPSDEGVLGEFRREQFSIRAGVLMGERLRRPVAAAVTASSSVNSTPSREVVRDIDSPPSQLDPLDIGRASMSTGGDMVESIEPSLGVSEKLGT